MLVVRLCGPADPARVACASEHEASIGDGLARASESADDVNQVVDVGRTLEAAATRIGAKKIAHRANAGGWGGAGAGRLAAIREAQRDAHRQRCNDEDGDVCES